MKEYQYHIFSPYRVCPLGAHVDHQHGLVTGFAIDKGVDFWFSPATHPENHVHLESRTFEGIVDFDNNSKGNSTTLRELSHIHGDLEMLNVLVGVNDVSQIANASLRNDIRVNQMLVKPVTNDMIDNEKNPHVSRILKNAMVIVIYGASLGDSDMVWREQLKECLKSESCYFLINEWQDDFDNIYDLNIVENEARNSFLNKLGLEDESEKYGKYIFVAVTKKMFKPVAE